ncbi:hypothetical protein [Rhizobium sp. C4]|uniref:hypothetical protein n=1 Tax=Rhizobium sp. C4 TaxID=1349800 RepID=UPI001E45AF35|nr:hypothetical protein [Rhizobium sp. C4]MCD2174167.1 hypothetical protein [Rhizobium sp. C4]
MAGDIVSAGHGLVIVWSLTMRVKSIALWVLAVILAAVLFYFFRDEMAHQEASKVSLQIVSPEFLAAA